MIMDREQGKITGQTLEKRVLKWDREDKLEVNISQLNYWILEPLLSETSSRPGLF